LLKFKIRFSSQTARKLTALDFRNSTCTRPQFISKIVQKSISSSIQTATMPHTDGRTVAFNESLAEKSSSALYKRRRSFESFQELIDQNHPPTSYLETMMHLLKGNVGTGCFAMADAMRNGGIILGPIMTLIIAVICVHAQHMLIKCADFLKAEKKLEIPPSFAETVELSFLNSKSEKWRKWGSPMKKVCNIFIVITQLGFCSVYVLFVGSTL
jgi:hypothetical protein